MRKICGASILPEAGQEQGLLPQWKMRRTQAEHIKSATVHWPDFTDQRGRRDFSYPIDRHLLFAPV